MLKAKRFQSQKKSGKPLHVLIDPGPFDSIVMALGFAALCVWQSAKPNRWFANRPFEYLGERSFSIYLLHPMVIYFSKGWVVNLYARLEPGIGAYACFACAALVMVEVLVMAEITYRGIEVPGIKLGRKVIGTMRGKAAQAG